MQKTDQENYTTKYTYDSVNNLVGINYDDGQEILYTYNLLRQRISMEDSLGMTNYELDELGRILEVVDYEDRTTSYHWNSRN